MKSGYLDRCRFFIDYLRQKSVPKPAVFFNYKVPALLRMRTANHRVRYWQLL